MVAVFDNKNILVGVCTFLVLTIVWQLFSTDSQLEALKEQVSIQEIEIEKLKSTFTSAEESSEMLWEEVIREAQGLVRHEEEVFREHLIHQAKNYVDLNTANETQVRKYVLQEVKKYVVSYLSDKKSGGAAGLVELAMDVKKFAKQFVLSDIPPNVRDWFVFFPSEASRLATYNASSEVLVRNLKKYYWVTPSPRSVPYVLSNPEKEDGSQGQVLRLLQILQNKKNGFFIECGAFDGETSSSTLYLERRMEWTGVLIEPSPDHFSKLLAKNRKSILIPACVSPKRKPIFTKFAQTEAGGKLILTNSTGNNTKQSLVDTFCFPFYTIYLALDKKPVDLFILSAGGFELDILRTIQWTLVDIATIMVSVEFLQDQKDFVKSFLVQQKYVLYAGGHKDELWAKNNLIFTKSNAKTTNKKT